MQVFDKRERAALLKKTKSALVSSGWQHKDVAVKEFDFQCQKNDIALFVQCIDSSVLNFKSVESISIYMERAKDSFKDFGVPSIFVLGEDYNFCDFSVFLKDGVIAILESQLGIIAGIDRFLSNPSADTLEVERLILSRSHSLSTAISKFYENENDVVAAAQWAESAARAAPKSLGLQQRAIELMKKAGKSADAAMLGRQALYVHPGATKLIKQMIELAQELGDTKELKYWSERLTAEPDVVYRLPPLKALTPKDIVTERADTQKDREKGGIRNLLARCFRVS